MRSAKRPPPLAGPLARAERLYNMGRPADALAECRRVLAREPRDPLALQLAAYASLASAATTAEFDGAARYGLAALAELAPAVHVPLARATAGALALVGRPDQALPLALALQRAAPGDPSACYTVAHLHRQRGDLEAFRRWADRGLACRDTTREQLRDRLNMRAWLGDLSAILDQFAGMETDAAAVGYAPPWLDVPAWRGEVMADETLLVHRRFAGYGDLLMTAHLVEPCARRVGRLVLDVPPALMALYAATFGHLANVDLCDTDDGAALPPVHRHAAYFELIPLVGPGDGRAVLVPPPGPTPERGPGVNVGIAWSASAKAPVIGADPLTTPSRCIPLSALAGPLLALPGITLHSLQVGPACSELDAFPAIRRHVLADFADTALVVVGLDAVVSVDTSVAHLAAGLGVPTLTLLAALGDWRWGLSGAATPWYRSMRLLRNASRDDWSAVADQSARLIAAGELPPRLGAALAARAGRGEFGVEPPDPGPLAVSVRQEAGPSAAPTPQVPPTR